MMLGAAGLLVSAGVMRWLGWIALILGIAAFIPVADFFALLGTLIMEPGGRNRWQMGRSRERLR